MQVKECDRGDKSLPSVSAFTRIIALPVNSLNTIS
uniref:Uncharacterized protein n=1 Tax=Arundo donax TaxID=35708 RepID=A0A0A9H233_ARUDO